MCVKNGTIDNGNGFYWHLERFYGFLGNGSMDNFNKLEDLLNILKLFDLNNDFRYIPLLILKCECGSLPEIERELELAQ